MNLIGQNYLTPIGKPVDSIETYPASEGFIAYQDSQVEPWVAYCWLTVEYFLNLFQQKNILIKIRSRLNLEDVELNKNYALIINSNAGLWGYSIGDTVKFISKNPYRLLVTGRIKHFISAFGEHVIGEEVEKAMKFTMEKFPEVDLVEFTVAPQVTPEEG